MLTGYASRRLLRAALTVAALSMIAFGLTRLSGDPAAVLIPPEASAEQRQALRADLGLDDPLVVQYWRFVRNAASGDFGESLRFGEPAVGLFFGRFVNTLKLAAAATGLALIGGTVAGVFAARYDRSLPARGVMLLAYLAQAIPSSVIALALVALFAVELEWLPTSGDKGLSSLALPAVSLGAFSFAAVARLVQAVTIETLKSDFVRCARMKGLPERTIMRRHVLPHALIPVASVASLHVAFFLGGSVIVETIFAWPGIGQLTIQAILARDYVLVQTIVFFASVSVVLLSLALDLAYVVIDPRMRGA